MFGKSTKIGTAIIIGVFLVIIMFLSGEGFLVSCDEQLPASAVTVEGKETAGFGVVKNEDSEESSTSAVQSITLSMLDSGTIPMQKYLFINLMHNTNIQEKELVQVSFYLTADSDCEFSVFYISGDIVRDSKVKLIANEKKYIFFNFETVVSMGNFSAFCFGGRKNETTTPPSYSWTISEIVYSLRVK